MNQPSTPNGKLILAAMIFAVSMTFIDQTIVAIAIPTIQDDLSLSATGVQWIINGYLLSLSALFAFGGRLADIAGHRRMVVLGVLIFATASALCGATPTGSLDESWLIVFRVIQGAGAAIMFPAALAIVLNAFPVAERGKAMAIFFAIAGGLTSIGPIAGGYLTEWTWRAIFWVNIPVAIIALFLIWKSKPADEKHPAPLDYNGTALITFGMGLSVLALQQSSIWGWDSVATWGCLAAGFAVLAIFVRYELRTENPLLRLSVFKDKAFAVDNVILFLLMIPFVPLFFFASMYAQISLGESASETGLYLLIFFAGFATASQWGGRILDRVGARPAIVLGCGVAADGPLGERPVVLPRPRRGRGRAGPQPRQHRRAKPGPARALRRGDRDHADRAQLRLQPRAGGARLDPDPREPLQPRSDRRRQRLLEAGRQRSRRPDQPGHRRRRNAGQPARRGTEALRKHPPRLRDGLANRVLRDGRSDGGRLCRRAGRDAGRQSRNRGRRLRRADFRRPCLTRTRPSPAASS
jgi:MFS family permease